MTDHEIIIIILAAIILMIQSLWLFLNARKNGHNYWFWGILGLIQAPMPTIFYLIFARRIFQSKSR
ncbi:sigma-Y antisigma factor component [Fredinandcohnia quinoae]|uniref:Sigma-Y antisigma factor component n=1 Tax=Fredinandcohnia quinoae TaxID=2918902 RepID=A0AAW5E3J0_9BACI|nr:sigma-Y antisigma factor component [Fredinandcohnia sp. SECRCQ15]MCH1627068.1 sigma-Y antisigma factor component [Fredinandcohnia sp. SECRCQ15]